MRFVQNLLNPFQHCEDAAAHLLQALKIPFTRSHLQKELHEHPDYPGMASIADVLGISYDVACLPLKISTAHFSKEPSIKTPFLAHIRNKAAHDSFAVVHEISEDRVSFYNPGTKKQETLTMEAFNQLYQGTILLVGAGSHAKEKDYEQHLKAARLKNLHQTIALAIVPVIFLIFGMLHLFSNLSVSVIAPVFFLVCTFAGTLITVALLWYEVDEYNPVVKQICQASAKVNCAAVLQSRASKIAGLSWSSLGFTYFMGVLLFLMMSGMSTASLALSGWLALLVLPYTLFSVYYQWKIARQWCRLCLMVQALLVLQFITALSGDFFEFPFLAIHWQSGMGLFTALAFVWMVTLVLLPALQKAKTSRLKTMELQRLKHNPLVFEGVLAKQRSLNLPVENLGISLGKPSAKYKLIKVCNPYCSPCARAHATMEELVEGNEEVGLQILFTATEAETDMKRAPVLHLLGISAKGNEAVTRQALNDWYLPANKDYTVFAGKYPLYGEAEKQLEGIKKMREWCDEVQISYTPTFFLSLNNDEPEPKFYQLPEMYSIADLKYFFTT